MTPPSSQQASSPPRSSRRWWAGAALGAVAFLFFWQYFLLDQTLYAGDTAFVFFPFRQYATERLMAGEFALWNPHIFGGTPALAESQYQLFYWPNLLFWITGVPRGIGWTLPLHLLWLSVGVYLLARRSFQLGRLEGIVAAVAFTYCGSVQGRLGIPVYTQAASWIPWILLGYDVARRRGGLTLMLPGLALAMQLLTGAPQYTYYSLVLLAALHVFRLREAASDSVETNAVAPPRPKTAWLALGSTLALGILLIGAQLVPEYELIGQSDRGARAAYEYITPGSLAPSHLVTMVLPKFYGLYSTMARDGFLPSTEVGYVGILTLGLACAAWFSPRRGLVRFWALMGALSLVLALGGNNPLFPLLYRFVPGVGMFRMPGTWLLVTALSLSFLAAIGLETLRSESERRLMAARAVVASILVMVVGAVILLLSPAGVGAHNVPQTPFGPWGQVAFIAVCAIPIIMLAMSRFAKDPKLKRTALLAIPALLALDLFLVSQDMEMQQTLSVEAVQTPSATAKALQAQITGPVAERFWPGAAQVPMEKWVAGDNNPNVSPLDYRANSALLVRALMPSCIPAEFGTMGLTGAWGALMPLRRHARPIYANDTNKITQEKWLRLLNVRTHLSLRPLDNPQLTLQSSEPLYIYRDTAALPRAFFVSSARQVQGEEAISLLSQPTFDPRREVLLETSALLPTPSPTNQPFDENTVRITSYSAERVSLEVSAPRAGYVVLMDTAYPGWRVRLNGQEVPLLTANWMGRAVAIPQGDHRVELRFEPTSVRLGTFLSLVTIAFLAACASSVLLSRRSASRG